MNIYEGDNFGSVQNAEIIEHYKIASVNPIVLKPGMSWISIPFKEESGNLFLKTEDSDNGTIYNYTVQLFINNMRNELDAELGKFLTSTGVLRVTDMNDRVYIIGGPDKPVAMNETSTTGQKFTNENGSMFDFTSSQSERALNA
jgi:hypothetical protein